MADVPFGMGIERVDKEPRPAVAADLSVGALVGPAPNADAQYFPLNTPVLIYSDDEEARTALGEGGLLDELLLTDAQLGEFQVAARVVILVTEEGADDTETMTNIVDNLEKLQDAGPMLGVIPRLVGVPGYTHQQEDDEGTLLANPVCAALPPVLNAMLAHAVVSGPHSTLQAYIDWRETLTSSRLIPIETWVQVGTPAEDIDSVGAAIGVGIRRDFEKSGRPFHSWANQPVYGIVGPSRPLNFSLTDASTEGQQILDQNGGVILRGEAGVETAIASGGFMLVATDTAAEDDLWRFYNVTRGRDYIHLTFLRTLRFYLGRFNLNGQTVQAVMNTMTLALRDLKADGDILGYKVGFKRDQNSPENLRLGRVTIDFAAEEAPVLRYIGLRSARYRPALNDLLGSLVNQSASLTG